MAIPKATTMETPCDVNRLPWRAETIAKQRLDEVRESRFSDETEGKRGHSDTQLRGGDIGIQVNQGTLDNTCPAVTFVRQLVNAGFADADQRKLGSDEKSIQQHQSDCTNHTECVYPVLIHLFCSRRTGPISCFRTRL